MKEAAPSAVATAAEKADEEAKVAEEKERMKHVQAC
jgi:hypothetical protein